MRAQPRQPVLRCFPRDDDEFAAAVAAAMLRVARDGQTRLGRAQSIVRLSYPNATIHPRDSLGAPLDDEDEVWYAFRDGRLLTRHDEQP